MVYVSQYPLFSTWDTRKKSGEALTYLRDARVLAAQLV